MAGIENEIGSVILVLNEGLFEGDGGSDPCGCIAAQEGRPWAYCVLSCDDFNRVAVPAYLLGLESEIMQGAKIRLSVRPLIFVSSRFSHFGGGCWIVQVGGDGDGDDSAKPGIALHLGGKGEGSGCLCGHE